MGAESNASQVDGLKDQRFRILKVRERLSERPFHWMVELMRRLGLWWLPAVVHFCFELHM
jgi:hypothetical protein